jgi:hypothetical protein
MSVAKIAWALVSATLAYGINLQMRPHFEAAYERSDTLQEAGTLTLYRDGGDALELPTPAAHVVTAQVTHLNKVIEIRELSIRSLSSAQSVPSFEIFASLPGSVAAQHDPERLAQLELALVPDGRLGERPSFVRRDAKNLGRVITGTLLFTDVRRLEENGKTVTRGEARLELQVEQERGAEMLNGKWNGLIVWN